MTTIADVVARLYSAMTDGTNQILTLTLMTDWNTGPFWVAVNDGVADPYDVEDIVEVVPLSAELLDAIAAWDQRFQATLNEEYPPDSGFPTPEEDLAFINQGRELARRLKAEAPAEVVVRYAPPHNAEPQEIIP